MHRKWVSTKIDGPWDGELLQSMDPEIIFPQKPQKSMGLGMGRPSNRWTLALSSTKIDGPWDGAPLKSMDPKIVFHKNRWTLGWGTPQIDGP